jgi:cation-transporting ATPase 13A1
LVFAIAASYYVWTVGSKKDARDRSKLLLHCIMIITSVVPPELPMELSLAVNNALLALSQSWIFCTEPFRIPFAGRIDVACFDKTGTLTAENLVITGLEAGFDNLIKPVALPKFTKFVLASAHALVKLEDGIIGDPMEKNTLESIQWVLGKDDKLTPDLSKDKISLKIIRRFLNWLISKVSV